MADIIGLDCVLKYKVGGGAGASVDAIGVKNVSLKTSKGEADTSTRDSDWKTYVATLKDAALEVEVQDRDSNAFLTALLDVYWDAQPMIGLRVLDGATGRGVDADFDVFDASREEPLEGAAVYKFTLKITGSRAPVRVGT